ncbi:MAG: hypothetical protein V3S64_14965, partial [bacterium]
QTPGLAMKNPLQNGKNNQGSTARLLKSAYRFNPAFISEKDDFSHFAGVPEYSVFPRRSGYCINEGPVDFNRRLSQEVFTGPVRWVVSVGGAVLGADSTFRDII